MTITSSIRKVCTAWRSAFDERSGVGAAADVFDAAVDGSQRTLGLASGELFYRFRYRKPSGGSATHHAHEQAIARYIG